MNAFKNLGIEPAEFLNTVREKLPKAYKSSVPIAEAGQTSFTGIGQVLDQDSALANVWHKTAVNLIGKIIQRSNILTNPLAEFEGDLMEDGAEIEEMIIDAAGTYAFNPTKAVKRLFDRKEPELRVQIHKSTRDVTSKRTIQDTQITQIFRNVTMLEKYIVHVTQSLLSGNEYEKYYTTKELLSTAIMNNKIRVLDLGNDVKAADIQEAIMTVTKAMQHPSRFFNMGNVGQPDARGNTGLNIQADFSQLRLILPLQTSVKLDVKFFANVFHLDSVKSGLAIKEIDFLPNIYQYTKDHIVTAEDLANGYVSEDNFEVGETIKAGSMATREAFEAANEEEGKKDIELKFDASRVKAIVLDKRALVINPQLPTTLSSVVNPEGRYINVILNEKEIFSFSTFMPACVIMAGEESDGIANVYDVLLDGASIKDPKTGIVNLDFSKETKEASDEVFGEIETMVNQAVEKALENKLSTSSDEEPEKQIEEPKKGKKATKDK